MFPLFAIEILFKERFSVQIGKLIKRKESQTTSPGGLG